MILTKDTKYRAFTLIELLVVIAIIVILIAVLIPALRIAKVQATAIVCLANVDGLSNGWYIYADDYDNFLVSSDVGSSVENVWAQPPQDETGAYDNTTLQAKINGIEAGALFPYIEAPEAYHCPSDRRYKDQALDGFSGDLGAYRSYSIGGSMNGQDWGDNSEIWVKKYNEINTPSSRLVFIEESEGGGWNARSWDLLITGWELTDPIAIWHNDRSILGFADGHGEKHKWLDERTLEMAERQEKFVVMPGNEDLVYLQRIYQPRGN